MPCICLVLAPFGNLQIGLRGESFAAARQSSRRQPCFPAFPAVARGAQFVSGCARRATVASALTANVIRHGICGGLHRAAARRIAIHPHLPGRMPSAERRLRRLPRLRLASLHAGDRALCAVIACQCFAFQRIAVQCLQFAFTAPRNHLRKVKPEGLTLLHAALCAALRRGSAAIRETGYATNSVTE